MNEFPENILSLHEEITFVIPRQIICINVDVNKIAPFQVEYISNGRSRIIFFFVKKRRVTYMAEQIIALFVIKFPAFIVLSTHAIANILYCNFTKELTRVHHMFWLQI